MPPFVRHPGKAGGKHGISEESRPFRHFLGHIGKILIRLRVELIVLARHLQNLTVLVGKGQIHTRSPCMSTDF